MMMMMMIVMVPPLFLLLRHTSTCCFVPIGHICESVGVVSLEKWNWMKILPVYKPLRIIEHGYQEVEHTQVAALTFSRVDERNEQDEKNDRE